jgi:23S rRNA (adenine2503-C2)-methyltransferase
MWDNVDVIQSEDCNVSKFVFTADDAVAEAVLYKYPTYKERTVICCSTQSGCPMGCRFCGSGDYFVRNLTSDEIVDQVVKCIIKTGYNPKDIDNLQVMFMSMGEPMLNWKNLKDALRILNEIIPNAKLLISTSAPRVGNSFVDMTKLSKEIENIGLQFSVHESTDTARDELIPFKAKMALEEIAYTGEYWYNATGRRPFFNYCVHESNNKMDDVYRLQELFDPNIWECTLSVICERDEHVAAANARQEGLTREFTKQMSLVDYSVRMFNPAGQDDIGGGCGQLWFVQDWMKNNPDKVKPSIGNKLIKVHTPR